MGDTNFFPFVPLRVHSSYSLLEGALPIEKITDHALKNECPAIAITDTRNLFGALEFSQKASSKGIQPIIGLQIDLSFTDDSFNSVQSSSSKKNDFSSICLFAANEVGYHNLIRLISQAYLKADSEAIYSCDTSLEIMQEGLICLTGGPTGPIGTALSEGKSELAEKRLLRLRSLFGDRLYVELERLENYDKRIEAATLELSYKHCLPCVAVNEAFFESLHDFEAHDALLCIAEGSVLSDDNRRRVSRDNYLKPSCELYSLFRDLPEALENTLEIAKRCSYYPKNREPILPRFVSHCSQHEDPLEAESHELALQAHEGLKQRLETRGCAENHSFQDYQDRLEYELSVIKKMKYSGYFLIVSDFIKWAKLNNIAVGPGRGSGAGSLVAYATTITDLDPLRFSLFFERFLNPERVSMPDFDIDFCQERREEVIRYVQEKYGHDQVGQIITFGTLQARAVLRDVGRVLEMPYSKVDRLCKMIPNNPTNPITLEKALEIEPRLREQANEEPIISRLLSIARKLEGLYRHASTHAAGIVIADRPLSDLVPMYRDSRSDMPVTQFNMKKVEDAGLVKFDFLGLKTLTVLQKAVELLKKRKIYIDLTNIELNDEKTYTMLSSGEVFGVFQLESAGMRKALIGMQPDRIEDIIALVALYRPGPLENIPTYNARKHKQEEIASIHPKVDPLLSETQGVIVYQEQVMQIAQELAGYSLAEADLLRRAMGKKIRSEMDSQRKRFVSGAIERDVEKEKANLIFDILAKFADYGFNKSHAAAYALVSYQTAYMKANFPVEFITASMTLDLSNTERLADFHRDATRLGIEIIFPCVLSSFHHFETDGKKIYYALSALKGIGDNAAEYIVKERKERGSFSNLSDFCRRMNPSIIGKRTLESLIMAGALDCFGYNRSTLMAGVEHMIEYASRIQKNALLGQGDIFGSFQNLEQDCLHLSEKKPWSFSDQLRFEFQVLGFYLSAHPLDSYKDFLEKMSVRHYSEFSNLVRGGATAAKLAGTLILKKEKKTRIGNKIGILTFSDPSGQYEALLFSEKLTQYHDLLHIGNSLLISVTAEDRPEGMRFFIQDILSLEKEINRKTRFHSLKIYLEDSNCASSILACLPEEGKTRIFFVFKDKRQREIEICLPNSYKVDFSIISKLRSLSGVFDIKFD